MSNIEDLVRQSLGQRAEDVETTPALWLEVDRRIARRRRVQVAAWSLAGATAVVIGALALPGIIAAPDPTPEVEPLPPGPVEEPETEAPEGDATDDDAGVSDDTDGSVEDVPDEPTVDESPVPSSDSIEVEGVQLPGAVVVASRTSIDLLGPAGRSEIATFLPEGESSVMGVAVRPGSTHDDLTVVAATVAEGLWDLRWYRFVDRELVASDVLEGQYAPGVGSSPGAGFAVDAPVFAPDGSALAWLELGPEAPTLRVIAWSDVGPGSDSTADDNASFTLEGAPQDPVLMDLIEAPSGAQASGETHWLRMATVDGEGSWYRQPIQRQGDGAWSLPSGGVVEVQVDGTGPVVAVAGVDTGGDAGDAGEPRWLLQFGADGGAVVRRSDAGGVNETSVPQDLFPGEGLAPYWLHTLGDGVLMGNTGSSVTYYLDLDASEAPARLPGEVAHAAPVR